MNDAHETTAHDDESLAALYVAGALDPDERLAFERRLDAGNEDALAAVRSYDQLIQAHAESIPPIPPREEIKSSIFDRIRAERQKDLPFIQRNDQAEWTDIGIPGVVQRTVHTDPEKNRQTFMLRMEAGARIPAHPHHGVEECYIIEGDINSYDTVFKAGDYFRADEGTQHGESWTDGGCLLLITAAIDEHAA